ncbi:SIP domain-containing protein [Homoserinibacter sp. GY 40078]|uniref:SIP domain-containing protein n=1 Tax=Homoserinibacter sp. GY 40078 TaxID=2603275 RepID=UPI0011CBD373|nr:SIP domain-containing protein [Homoserinibacter sp. GY 40078]TXK17236.1 siderophore-interacting protein [Homoserinibacter sp. GY 40078]
MLISDVLPATIAWNPGEGDSVLLGAIDSDIAIAETVAAGLPEKARGRIFLEVADASSVRPFSAPGRVCVTWLFRDRGQSLRAAVDAWLAEMLPVEAEREHQVYAWVSGDRAAHALSSN